MKYLVIVIAVLTLVSAGSVGYLYLNPGYFVHSTPNDKMSSQLTSDQAKDLNSRLNKLQNELANLKDTVARQSIILQELQVESKLVSAGKRLQVLSSENTSGSNISNQQSLPDAKTNPAQLSYQGFSPELFNNPEFAKLFHDQVNQVVQDIQKEEQEARIQQMNAQMQQRIVRRIDEFAKAQNLNDYQKQELNKIVTDRFNKSMELFSQMRSSENSVNPDEARTKMDTLRNESNAKVQQILLPQQYDEYKKIENQLSGGGRGRMPQAGQGTTPAPR